MMQEPNQEIGSIQNRSQPITEEFISESLLQEDLLAEEERRMLHNQQASSAGTSENSSASPNPAGDNLLDNP